MYSDDTYSRSEGRNLPAVRDRADDRTSDSRKERARRRLQKRKRSLYLLAVVLLMLFGLTLLVNTLWMRWLYAALAFLLTVLGCMIRIPGTTRGVYFVMGLILIGIVMLPVLRKDTESMGASAKTPANTEPTPAPTVDVSAGYHHGVANNLFLYYHESSSSYYHLDQNCPAVSSAYLPLKNRMFYQDLTQTKFRGMMPCASCIAPARPHAH